MMPHEFTYRKMVEFAETDMAGILHFSNYFRYMEMAEHAFYRSLGFSVETRVDDMLLGWPRIQVECEYRHPLRFEEWVEVHLRVAARSARSITYHFTLTRTGDPPVLAARGKFTVVCTRTDSAAFLKSMTIPEKIAELIEVAPEGQASGGA